MRKIILLFSLFAIIGFSACNNAENSSKADKSPEKTNDNYTLVEGTPINIYAKVQLTSDISHLSASEKEVLKIMFQVADIMEDIYWQEAYGDRDALLAKIGDENLKLFTKINYGPWDRLNGNKAFLNGFGAKPDGANFYPTDMTKEEFEALEDSNKKNLYTVLRRDENGALKVVWYHEAFKEEIAKAADLLKKASEIAENPELKTYLSLRAEALLTDNYQPSDMAWMDMKNSNIDFVVGPIENYEDHLFGYKAAHESFILIKDVKWSEKLKYYAQFLPQMQKELPVDAKYKAETPGSDVDLNAYDVVYYAGDCNAGSKTIAINLPNDEEVQLQKGSRKLQLKNAMRAKFDKILIPISEVLIDPEQRSHIQFDAFFANTMFHEVSHGMGIKNTITGNGTCRTALKEQYSALEEGKADILGLYLVTKLANMGELGEIDLNDNYVTFMASIFRSIRFGAASAHGKANLIRFNYFLERGAFTRLENGTYHVNIEKMKEASTSLTQDILKLQGDGDYEVAKAFVDKWSVVTPQLKEDLQRLADANIPKDIYYEQGPQVLGL
jgi:hypothetical protein